MYFEENLIYHVYNQGNNHQPIFYERENYLFFLRKMRKHLLPNADILSYCLMPNHFHWLIVPKLRGIATGTAVKGIPKITQITGTSKVPVISATKQQRLTQDIGTLLSSYTKAINKRLGRSGSLFRSKTKAKNGWIDGFITVNGQNKEQIFRPDNDYALRCFSYIHDNPVKANLTIKATDWEFSSARDYGGLRQGTLCNAALATDILGEEIRAIGS